MPKLGLHSAIHRRSGAAHQHGPPAYASEATPFCERLCPVVMKDEGAIHVEAVSL
jgi:hypothetical protein